MELLTAPRAADVPAPGVQSPPRFRWGFGLSIVGHAALLVAAIATPARRIEQEQPMVMIEVVAPEPSPAISRAEQRPPPVPPLPRPVPVRRAATAVIAPVAPAAPPPAPVQEAPPEEVTGALAPVVSTVADAPTTAPVLAVGAPAVGRPAPGVAGGVIGGTASGSPGPLSVPQRSALVGHYRELLRQRIKDGFRYPAEARELELVGQVLVSITVNARGQLVAARVRGACPHALLCDDALRTVRAAAPFAPPPRDLGDTLQVEIPLNYAFE